MQSQKEALKTFALMYLMDESQDRDVCLRLLDGQDQEQVQGYLSHYLELDRKAQKKAALAELRKSFQSNTHKVFTEIDPNWYVNALKEETPKVTRLILGNLDRERQKLVVRTLPKALAKQVKEQKPVHQPSGEVFEILKQFFEKHFPQFPPFNKDEALSFENLHALSKEQILELFRNVGLMELAVALKEVNKSALRAILHRMSIGDAKLLQAKIKSMGELDEQRKMNAQLNVLAIDLDKVSTQHFFLEIGFCVFARAIEKEHKSMVNALQYKLSPKEGYILKRYMSLVDVQNEVKDKKVIQELVLEHLESVFGAD